MEKVPKEHKFIDFSDYARPLASRMALLLKDTPIRAIHITLLYFIIGILAAYLIYRGDFVAAGLLILLKNVLDAVDGSLARLQNRPSRVGRFADSISDIILNFLFIFAIALHYKCCYSLAALAFISVSLQGTVFNYYYVLYRHKVGGDATSRVDESPEGYPWDNPMLLRILYALYVILYKWQDILIMWFDRTVLRNPAIHSDRVFLSVITMFGLGVHLLILAIFLLAGKPIFALWILLYMGIVMLLFLITYSLLKGRQ